jgi:hypothetical protein
MEEPLYECGLGLGSGSTSSSCSTLEFESEDEGRKENVLDDMPGDTGTGLVYDNMESLDLAFDALEYIEKDLGPKRELFSFLLLDSTQFNFYRINGQTNKY